jgi:hypothetical protein
MNQLLNLKFKTLLISNNYVDKNYIIKNQSLILQIRFPVGLTFFLEIGKFSYSTKNSIYAPYLS